jgi:hypothetical protein
LFRVQARLCIGNAPLPRELSGRPGSRPSYATCPKRHSHPIPRPFPCQSGSNRDVSMAAQRCEPPFQCSAPDGQVRPVIFKYWTLVRWHPSGLPPWQRRLPAALAARGRRRVRRQEPLQRGAIPLARIELVGWPAAWRPKIAAPSPLHQRASFSIRSIWVAHRHRMSAFQRRRSGLERLPRAHPGWDGSRWSPPREDSPGGKHDIADDAVAAENVVAGTLTELRPPDPIGAMRRP